MRLAYDADTYIDFNVDATGQLSMGDGQEYMRLDNGSLLIGTTTNLGTLTIQGTAGANLLSIASSTGANLLTMLQNGNFGIGTTTPSYESNRSRRLYAHRRAL